MATNVLVVQLPHYLKIDDGREDELFRDDVKLTVGGDLPFEIRRSCH